MAFSEIAGLFKTHLRDVTKCAIHSVQSLKQAVEAVFKGQSNKSVKQFDKIAFEKGAIMTGKEAREEYERKQKVISDKKDMVESNKRKRLEKMYLIIQFHLALFVFRVR